MVKRYSDADIDSMKAFYEEHGAVKLPGLLDAQTVRTILDTIDASAARAEAGEPPGEDMSFGRAEGRLTIRYMWRAIPTIREFMLQPELAEPIARIVGTQRLHFWFDLTFMHNGSTQGDAGAGTPWHHDGSVFHFKGMQLPSLWMAMTPANADRSRLKFIDGSHKTVPGFYRSPDNPAPADGSKDGFLDVPDFDALVARGEERVLTWDCEPGDAIIIHPLTIHGADGNKGGAGRRVAITTRWLGDDVRFLPNSYAKAMQSTGLAASDLVIGGRPKGDYFPVVWDAALHGKA
jgi:ectoine hydroxylase-related dioxygenase (phytanoyl-CoA dioxygenase family)